MRHMRREKRATGRRVVTDRDGMGGRWRFERGRERDVGRGGQSGKRCYRRVGGRVLLVNMKLSWLPAL